eukprot:scaffold20070_cov58-Attheya_sp.AAC.2
MMIMCKNKALLAFVDDSYHNSPPPDDQLSATDATGKEYRVPGVTSPTKKTPRGARKPEECGKVKLCRSSKKDGLTCKPLEHREKETERESNRYSEGKRARPRTVPEFSNILPRPATRTSLMKPSATRVGGYVETLGDDHGPQSE